MLKNKKFVITACAILCVLITAVIWTTGSLKKNAVEDKKITQLDSSSISAAATTQIDRIILNSESNEEDSMYHMAVILPDSASNTSLQQYVDSGAFKQYVIDHNRTIADQMVANKIEVKTYKISDLNAMVEAGTLETELGTADFIYVYAASATSYVGNNAISEDVYKFLQSYAFGVNKPFMIDYPLNSTNDNETTVTGTMTNLVSLATIDFARSWKYYKTYSYEGTWDDTSFKTFVSSNRSLYTPLNNYPSALPSGFSSWADYWKRTGTADPTANILYLGNNDEDEAVMQNLKSKFEQAIKDNGFYDSAIETLPSEYVSKYKNASEVSVNDFYVDAAHVIPRYDYIFIMPNTYSATTDISADVRVTLNSLSENKSITSYIIFGDVKDGSTTSGGASGGGNSTLTFDTSTNYGKLIDLSITTSGYAKKSNVLVTNIGYVDKMNLAPSNNVAKSDEIASIINKGKFRNYAGAGSGSGSGSVSTTAFRVLELQPCYPIDLDLAKNINAKSRDELRKRYGIEGNYYTVPGDVVNGLSEDEIATGVQYYQWDLSKAKLAYALNIPADQIELVQMSTEEFITSKADVTNSYDLIYIGGNKSALKPSTAYGYSSDQWGPVTGSQLAVFSMYTHTGEISQIIGGNFVGKPQYAYTQLNGNDLTYNKLLELQAYIDSGMPMVFGNEVWDRYGDIDITSNVAELKNKYIDPDSNMYQLLEYANSKKDSYNNLLCGWENKSSRGLSADNKLYDYYIIADAQKQKVDNSKKQYGSLDEVTVFKDDISDELYDLVYNNNVDTRPKFSLDTNAYEYIEGNTASYVTERNLTWKVTLENPIEGHRYKAVVLRDTNDNGIFDLNTEVLASEELSDTVTLSYDVSKVASDFFGAFSWKVLVVDVTDTLDNKVIQAAPSNGYAAISFIDRQDKSDTTRKQASVLEIMPMETSQVGAQDGQDGHTLYLDSNYQQGRGNPFLYSNFGTTNANNYGYCFATKGDDTSNPYNGLKCIVPTKNGYNYQNNVYLGKYQSNLSINRYDATGNYEDWDYNYVDSISDNYNISLDIMYAEDIEFYAKTAASSSAEEQTGNLEKADAAYATYKAYTTPGTVSYNTLHEKEEALRKVFTDLRDGKPISATINGETKTVSGSQLDISHIDGILNSGDYFKFFYTNQITGGGVSEPAYIVYWAAYYDYIMEHDKMVDAYREYRHYNMMAYGPEEYLRNNYDVIVVGFYDDYMSGFQDLSTTACTQLDSFLEKDGSLLLTHDTMSKYASNANGKTYSINLTASLQEYVGMNRFHAMEPTEATRGSKYVQFTTTKQDQYFLTNMSNSYNFSNTFAGTISEWNTNAKNWANTSKYSDGDVGYPGLTDIFICYETRQSRTLPYTYAECQIEDQIKYNLSYAALDITGTTKATQVNRGVVTTYPFYIASDLRVSPTHNQAYTLDLDNEDVTVWYTFAGDNKSGTNTSGTNTSGGNNYETLKNNSSFYAASPKDGTDSYFIYSLGNVTYCGAGHAMITGDQRDNNDERRLFLNVLVNMAQKSGKAAKEADPSIVLYDPDGTTKAPGKYVKQDESGYYIETTSSTGTPAFAFGVDKTNNQTITDVQVFYDLNYMVDGGDESNDYTENSSHVMVTLPNSVITELNENKTIILSQMTTPTLLLQRSYFTPYGGEYTYLVVKVVSKNAKDEEMITYQRIKVKLVADLLDLT